MSTAYTLEQLKQIKRNIVEEYALRIEGGEDPGGYVRSLDSARILREALSLDLCVRDVPHEDGHVDVLTCSTPLSKMIVGGFVTVRKFVGRA